MQYVFILAYLSFSLAILSYSKGKDSLALFLYGVSIGLVVF